MCGSPDVAHFLDKALYFADNHKARLSDSCLVGLGNISVEKK